MAPKAKRQASNPPKAKAAAPAAKSAAKAAAGKAAAAKAAPAKVEEAADQEAEAAKKAAEEAEVAKRKAETEAELQRLAALANGEVTIKYSMYAEKFKIEKHQLTAKAIDEVYCLSDVMPGCFIHLAEREFAHGEEQSYMKEDPPGTFHGLMSSETYWCYVQQDAEQEKRDQEAMRSKWAGRTVAGGVGDRGSESESCSCGWGAPCTNPMICKDWDNRFANAIKAGGNPILFTG